MTFKDVDIACDWLSENVEKWVWADWRDRVHGVAMDGLLKYFRKAMTEAMCKEAGWIPVKETPPPFGVRVNVCVARAGGQSIWQQTFKSDREVEESGITHWGYEKA